jgi:hypothetical protein
MTKQQSRLANTLTDEIRELADDIKEDREGLGLKIRLGGADVRQEWRHAEKKWREFKAKTDLLEKAAAGKNTSATAKLLAQELKRTYTHIYNQL